MASSWIPDGAVALAHLFNHPVISGLLLALAFLGLVAEVRADGLGKPGVAGLLALGLFFASHLVEGATAWLLPVAGVGLLLLWPALRDPSRRWAARTGIAVLAVSVYLALLAPAPAPGAVDHVRAALVLVAATLLVTLAGALLWMRLPASLRPERRGEVFFVPTRGEPPEEGIEPHTLVGRRGLAATPLRPEGTALVGEERLEVTTDGEWVEEGEEVEVVSAEGLRARVRAVGEGVGGVSG